MTTTFREEDVRRPARDALFGPAAADLMHRLDHHLCSAWRLLAAQPSEAAIRGVECLLADADDLFASLVRNAEIDDRTAQRIENIRDRLGGHLVAALDLDSADVPSAAILRRGVHCAVAEIRALRFGS